MGVRIGKYPTRYTEMGRLAGLTEGDIVDLRELMERVSTAYDVDGAILRYFNSGTDGLDDIGDSLAVFIVNELRDTYDPEASNREQLAEARRVMWVARNQLLDVIGAIEALGAIEQRRTRKIHLTATLPEDTRRLQQQREDFSKTLEATQNEENSPGKKGEET